MYGKVPCKLTSSMTPKTAKKDKRLKTERNRLYLHATTESRSSRQSKSSQKVWLFGCNGPWHVEKASPNKNYLVPQSRNTQNKGTPSYATTTAHAWGTYNQRTNNVTGKKTWPWGHHQTWWLVCQSMGVSTCEALFRQPSRWTEPT